MFVEPIKNKKFMFVERGGKKVHVRCLVIQLPILPSHLTSPHLTRKCETTSDCDLISFHSDLKLREREREREVLRFWVETRVERNNGCLYQAGRFPYVSEAGTSPIGLSIIYLFFYY